MSKASTKRRKRRNASIRARRDLTRIRTFGDPALSAVCAPIDMIADHLDWIENLVTSLAHAPNGVGLAAPQIGVLKRAFIIWPGREARPVICLNPVMTVVDLTTYESKEGCLSYPGYSLRVKRYMSVHLDYMSWGSIPTSEDFDHRASRIIQHEMAHLDGICEVRDAWLGLKGGARGN